MKYTVILNDGPATVRTFNGCVWLARSPGSPTCRCVCTASVMRFAKPATLTECADDTVWADKVLTF